MPNLSAITSATCPSMEKHIDSLVFREVEPESPVLPIYKIIPPNHFTSLDFFFGHPFKTIDLKNGKEVPYKTTAIRGCRTTAKYAIEFDKPFASFSIKFTPTGLYNLLGMDLEHFTDADISCLLLKLPFDINELYKKIERAINPAERVAIIENTFSEILLSRSPKSRLSGLITNTSNGNKPQIFLSERQQQRLYRQEVGLSPKSFSNLQRFSSLLRSKKQNETKSWTALAHEFGYYDQAHFIKAFYSFLGIMPSLFHVANYAL